jgi:hypothetical protein
MLPGDISGLMVPASNEKVPNLILVAKSTFTLRMKAFKMEKSIAFDFATSIRSGHEPFNGSVPLLVIDEFT